MKPQSSDRCRNSRRWLAPCLAAAYSNRPPHAAERRAIQRTRDEPWRSAASCACTNAGKSALSAAPLGLAPSSSETTTQSLFLSAAQAGPLTIDWVSVEYVAGHDDTRLSANAAVSIVDFTSGASGTTIRIGLTLAQREFSHPGTYRIGLRIRGKHGAAASPTPIDEVNEVSVTRAAAQITVKIGADSRVIVERNGEQKVSFSVIQQSGPEISNLNLVQGTVGRSSDNVVVPGKVELAPTELTLGGGAASGKLRFSGFNQAGDYKSDLSFTSPNLSKPVTVPITIRVRDGWGWALFTIILGVLGGTLVYSLTHMWRPRQLLAFRVTQLVGRLQVLEGAISEPATRQEYDRLRRRLYILEQGIDLDLTNDAGVQQVQSEIEAFEAKIAKVQADADQALKRRADQSGRLATSSVLLGEWASNSLTTFNANSMAVEACMRKATPRGREAALRRQLITLRGSASK